MTQDEALAIFERAGGYLKGDHFAFASGCHSDTYVNKDAVYPHTADISRLCHMLAEEFAENGIETVIGPAIGGVIITQWVAHHLTCMTGREILAVYAEKCETSLQQLDIALPQDIEALLPNGTSVICRMSGFVIRRGYEKLIAEKRCLCVEDILTTGRSIAQVVEAVRTYGGDVVGLGALWNRGNVTREHAGDVPKSIALINKELPMWKEDECPLCMAGEPIDTYVGHGREF